MVKISKISGTISTLEVAPNNWAVEAVLFEEDILPLCLDLALLRFELASTIVIQTSSKQIAKWKYEGGLRKSQIINSDSVTIVFSLNDLETLLCFLLHYHRDSQTPVNHLDIELECAQTTLDYTLVIQTSKFAPPMPGDEARKLLGLK